MTKPISPGDMAGLEGTFVPDEVIEATNQLIAEKWNGYSATILMSELCERARTIMQIPNRNFKSKELDIKYVFRKAGWDVEFNRPGFNEAYAANWVFTKP